MQRVEYYLRTCILQIDFVVKPHRMIILNCLLILGVFFFKKGIFHAYLCNDFFIFKNSSFVFNFKSTRIKSELLFFLQYILPT